MHTYCLLEETVDGDRAGETEEHVQDDHRSHEDIFVAEQAHQVEEQVTLRRAGEGIDELLRDQHRLAIYRYASIP